MLDSNDEKLLKRAITRNQCVLFLGAGFSGDATNKNGDRLPASWQLAVALWEWMGYRAKYGDYDDTPLDRLFDVARRERGDKKLAEFLEGQLLVSAYPDWYKRAAYPYWYRIYTTNVDDLIERVYRDAAATKLDTINSIQARYKERDAYLERLQYVKLNGSIKDGIDHITFGARQYARRASEYEVWYDQFVRDYSTHATVLVGTKVNEPLFWQAIEARQRRSGAAQELRLRSFLVSNKASPVVLNSLAEFNVVPVEATAEEFFNYLGRLLGDLPDRAEVLAHVNPQRAQYLSLDTTRAADADAAKAFFAAFTRVEVADSPRNHRSLYHSGATPDWADLAAGLDAQREVTARAQQRFESALESENSERVFVVSGHRGAGKSTLLMRTALNLSAAGHLVFFAVGEDIPEPHLVARAVGLIKRPMALFVDDAEWLGRRAHRLVSELEGCGMPPVLVLASRSNSLFMFDEVGHKDEIEIGNLTDEDIEAVIDVMEKANSLAGRAGQTRTRIREEFKLRARKQLLVAMKEITSGRDFEFIIKKEYHDIVDPELRLTYLIACLATAAGASLTRKQLLAASELPPALLLSGLERELKAILLHADRYGDRVIARHSVVAESVIDRVAPKPALSAAYKRILAVLANDMDASASRGEPRKWFRLYKALVNHKDIYRRFERDLEEARSIFDALMPRLTGDPHYWLQYGSLELEFGELDFANRYISTAESLAPDDFQIQNAKGHLLLALARSASSLAEAEKLRREGEAVLDELIERRGHDSDYPWHILIAHTLDWIDTWIRDAQARRAELKQLRERVDEACDARPMSDALHELRERVDRAYLLTAV